MNLVRVCSLTELDDGKPLHVDVDDIPLVIVKDDEKIYALYDECTHAAVALSEGDVRNGTIECWLHGSTFDLATGKPLCLPATEPVEVFDTHIDGDDVLVAFQESHA